MRIRTVGSYLKEAVWRMFAAFSSYVFGWASWAMHSEGRADVLVVGSMAVLSVLMFVFLIGPFND